MFVVPHESDVCVDFETFYRSKKKSKGGESCSVTDLGNWAYTHHPEWYAYLVSICSADLSYCGPVESAPWDKLIGRRWISHNTGFDRSCYERLVELGKVPHVPRLDWVDTADLAAYLSCPRNLAQASEYLLGKKVSKAARDSMDGRHWNELTEDEKNGMIKYAAGDAETSWELWQKFAGQWPLIELRLSLSTIEQGMRGIPCAHERIGNSVAVLERALWLYEQDIPWIHEKDEKGKFFKLGSPKAFRLACIKADVPVPAKTSIKDEDFLEWLDEYGHLVEGVAELLKWRRIKRALDVFRGMLVRTKPDGRLDLGLKYYGAHTGRWAGTAGVNLQNLQKAPIYFSADYRWSETKVEGGFEIDARACLVASPGNQLLIADLSQIEPRVLQWTVGNKPFLAACRSGQSPYEAAARTDGSWTRPESLKKEAKKDKGAASIYALKKANVLSLGYGAGWRKYIGMAAGYVGPEVFDQIFAAAPTTEEQRARFISFLEFCHQNRKRDLADIMELWEAADDREKNIWVNSWIQVTKFRQDNPLLFSRERRANGEAIGFHVRLDEAFKASARDQYFELELPSGRFLRYFDVSSSYGWTARTIRGQKYSRTYGGLLAENWTQAVARDVFALAMLRLEEAGYRILFSVHDEVIIDAPPGTSLDEVCRIIAQPPDWAPSLPVEAEAEFSAFYKK